MRAWQRFEQWIDDNPTKSVLVIALGWCLLALMLGKAAIAQTVNDVRPRLKSGVFPIAATWPNDPDGDLLKVCFYRETVLNQKAEVDLGCVTSPTVLQATQRAGYKSEVKIAETTYYFRDTNPGAKIALINAFFPNPGDEEIRVFGIAEDLNGNQSAVSPNRAIIDFMAPVPPIMVAPEFTNGG